MTATPSAPAASSRRLTTSIQVTCTSAGIPLHLIYRDRHYTVGADPVRWYQRRRWWIDEHRAAIGHGIGLVDHEMWRLQIRLSRAPRDTELTTVDVCHHLDSGRWRMVRVHTLADDGGTGTAR